MITMQLTVGHMCRLANALGWAMYAEVQHWKLDRTRTPHLSLAREDIRDILDANPSERRDLITHMRNAVRWARRHHQVGGVL